jgi:hypothetical protein
VRARELKAAGLAWTEVPAVDAESRWARLAAEILSSSSYRSTGEMVRAFVQQGGGCRATFFNYRRRRGGVSGSPGRMCPFAPSCDHSLKTAALIARVTGNLK